MNELKQDLCIICNKPVEDYEPKMCCDGYMCGCMGLAIEPCICSERCWDAAFNYIGKSFKERRKLTGIKIWELL